MTVDEFLRIVRKWNDCTRQQFKALLTDTPPELIEEEYHRFSAMPLDYFLSLDRAQQGCFLKWFQS